MSAREESVPAVQLFQGTIVHSTTETDAEVNLDSVLVVERGRVSKLAPASQLQDILQRTGATTNDVIKLGPHQLLMPGMIDAHIHPCQYPNAGLALDMPLLEWLEKYTFPLEQRFEQDSFAHEVYSAVVERTLRYGTTCASYFASIHRSAGEILVDICRQKGQRALVGKCNMDRNAPEFYVETTDQSLKETTSFVNNVLSGADGRARLVQPTITPRFAITCSERLLKGLGDMAQEQKLHVQTHCDECLPEVEFVQKLFPDSANYVDVYKKAGLLGPRTVLAHCVHVVDDEIDIMRTTGTGVAHCPASNINIKSGLCDVRRLEGGGVAVGLGTDVSGGYHPAILDSLRVALQTTNIHAIQRENYEPFNFRHGFKLATLGGATALGLDDQIGNFEPGKQLDAILVSLGDGTSEVDLLKPMSADELLQKFLYLGDSRDIKQVYVAGREVVSNPALEFN